MDTDQDSNDNFNLQTTQKKTIWETISEVIANLKLGISLVLYFIAITILLGLGYVVLRITIWAAYVVTRALGL